MSGRGSLDPLQYDIQRLHIHGAQAAKPCRKKRRASYVEAINAAAVNSEKYDQPQGVHWCPTCAAWHVTTKGRRAKGNGA